MMLGYTVTYLEMTQRPDWVQKPAPEGVTLVRAHNPPAHFFYYLYNTVGADYEWTDMHEWALEDVQTYVGDAAMHVYVAYKHGTPAGFVMLDFREAGICDVAYFGLFPECVGGGLGGWLLREGVRMAWDAGIGKLTVNTCTLDHESALPLYRKVGFAPVHTEEHVREVSSV